MDNLLDAAPCGFVSFADDGTILLANATLLGLLGRELHKVQGQHIQTLLSVGARIFFQTHVFPLLKLRGSIEEIFLTLVSEQGAEIPVLLNGKRRTQAGTEVSDWVVVPMRLRHRFEDELLAAKKAAEAAKQVAEEAVRATERAHRTLLELQKLESLSVLAGGIAHDFNNLLGVVLGHAELALLDLPTSDRARPSVEQIREAGVRAAELTAQMLAYSGRGRLVVGPLDLAALIREMDLLLHASVPKDVALHYALDAGLPLVEADAAQLRQAVVNLVLNAAEALGEQGGQISVRLSRRHVERADLVACYLSPELPPGDYLAFAVADTGGGMDEATRLRIFEPFFTTKFTGRGLGLAAVFGIVRAHQGAIHVTSAPQQGTIITLLLPALTHTVSIPARPAAPQRAQPATARTVLVIDDEAGVRQVATRMLERLGYRVVAAASGQEGLDRLAAQPEINCVLLDLTMPGLSGEETLHRIRERRPGLSVIIASGYSAQEVRERLGELPVLAVLQKPFTLAVLREVMQGVRDEMPAVPLLRTPYG